MRGCRSIEQPDASTSRASFPKSFDGRPVCRDVHYRTGVAEPGAAARFEVSLRAGVADDEPFVGAEPEHVESAIAADGIRRHRERDTERRRQAIHHVPFSRIGAEINLREERHFAEARRKSEFTQRAALRRVSGHDAVTSICPEGGRRQANPMDPRWPSRKGTMNPPAQNTCRSGRSLGGK